MISGIPAALGMTVLAVLVAGCSFTFTVKSGPRRVPVTQAPYTPRTYADCFLLPRAKARAVLGIAVSRPQALPPGLCVYSLPRGLGTLNFAVTEFRSAAMALGDLRQRRSQDTGLAGMKVAPVSRLGQQAMSFTTNNDASVDVVIGTREFGASIFWDRITTQMVITLARDAVRRLTHLTPPRTVARSAAGDRALVVEDLPGAGRRAPPQ
jgi:hypothetical protein